jgi:hypothetical protein
MAPALDVLNRKCTVENSTNEGATLPVMTVGLSVCCLKVSYNDLFVSQGRMSLN